MGYKETKKQRERKKDKEFCRRTKIKRVLILCNYLEGRFSAQETTQRLNSLPKIRPDIREISSLNNVKEVLTEIPFVTDICCTKHGGYEDTSLKYDLVATLSEQNLEYIGIQVKSSDAGIKKFLRENGFGFPNPDQNKFNERRLILLNGQESHEIIKVKFLTQFSSVNDFYSYESST